MRRFALAVCARESLAGEVTRSKVMLPATTQSLTVRRGQIVNLETLRTKGNQSRRANDTAVLGRITGNNETPVQCRDMRAVGTLHLVEVEVMQWHPCLCDRSIQMADLLIQEPNQFFAGTRDDSGV